MLKFLVPNAITSASIAFAVLSIEAAAAGHPRSAAWWILYCVFSDKLDGLAARALSASSPFGVQLDSLADLVAFGVAPAALVYSFLSTRPELGWSEGWHAGLLRGISLGYVICAAIRLARFNVTTETPGAEKIFFGTPSTFVGGLLAALFATLLKYGDPAWGGIPTSDWYLFGEVRLDWLMPQIPWLMAAGGLGMVSSLRVPKLGRTVARGLDWLLVGNIGFCYLIGFAHRLPEILMLNAAAALIFSVAYHFVWSSARAVKPPRLFAP